MILMILILIRYDNDFNTNDINEFITNDLIIEMNLLQMILKSK